MIRLLKSIVSRILGPPVLEEAELLRSALPANGVLFEVGAHFGDDAFMRFVASGWEVHAFEPDPSNRAELERKVEGFQNVVVVPKAVGDQLGTMTLFTSTESTGISSLLPFTPGHLPSIEVEVITLSSYVRDAAVERVDFLKMDVEGYEKFVISGFPWSSHRPSAVVLEFEDRKTQKLGYSWQDLAEALTAMGYLILVSEWHPIVRYGVTHRWRRFVTYPTALAHPDAWGNLIAVEPEQFRRVRRVARMVSFRYRLRRLADQLWRVLFPVHP